MLRIEVGRITYTRRTEPDYFDNVQEVIEFVEPQPPCPTCNGYGEYESEYGPRGCGPCNSRLVIIRNQSPNLDVDWGDTVIRYHDGTFELIKGNEP